MLHNRAVVLDYPCANKIYWDGYYGTFLGVNKPRSRDTNAPLELSLIEAAYLVERNKVKVVKGNRILNLKEILSTSRETIERFEPLYRVYVDLKERGFVVRRGLKFGCDYMIYRHGPGIDHAPFGALVYSAGDKVDPIEFVRAGRLLHSVRKKLVVAVYNRGKVDYYVFSWWKP
ncbi:MAG: tRNA-intron lyase [Desulfurococcaceae archaeon]|nr:tRNA-intron lyase [Desulfurococcaceae archaeon]